MLETIGKHHHPVHNRLANPLRVHPLFRLTKRVRILDGQRRGGVSSLSGCDSATDHEDMDSDVVNICELFRNGESAVVVVEVSEEEGERIDSFRNEKTRNSIRYLL